MIKGNNSVKNQDEINTIIFLNRKLIELYTVCGFTNYRRFLSPILQNLYPNLPLGRLKKLTAQQLTNIYELSNNMNVIQKTKLIEYRQSFFHMTGDRSS
jgi:hypothetical protein